MKKQVVAIIIAATVAAAGGYFTGRQQTAPVLTGEQTQQRKVLYWYDPMMPDQRFDKPGKSPFMDMQLVPRYADDAVADGGITVSARQQQNLAMTTAKVEKRVIGSAFQAFATVTIDERSMLNVPAPAPGVVEKLFVRAPQQWVKKGDSLAQLWIPQWTAAQQEYLAVRQLGDASLTRAARERLGLQFMPEAIIRTVERTGRPQTRLILRAERDGYVVSLNVREGAQVAAMQTLLELASLDPVWLVVDYPQTEAQALALGSDIVATSAGFAGEQFHGRVSELLPQLDTTTRTLKARIVLDNPQQKLKPGMFLTVMQQQAAQSAVLAIPEEALIETGAASRVLVATGEGHFKPVNVTVGRSAQGWTEVLSGLTEGEPVVTSGQFLIDSEASLRSALPEPQSAASTLQEYHATGVVDAIETGSITLSHQPIPALNWGAMTMDFGLKQPQPALKPGDRVMFSFTLDDNNGAVITHLMPVQEGAK